VQRVAIVNLAGGLQSLAAGTDIDVGVVIEAEVFA
jgi:hypothetical protein